MIRLADLKQRRLDQRDGHDQSTVDVRHRMSNRSGCGDTNQFQNIRTHREMSGRIQVFLLLTVLVLSFCLDQFTLLPV